MVFLALGYSEALWRNKRSSNYFFMPRALSKVQKTDSRMPSIPQKYDPSNLVFTPQKFPVQKPARSDFKKPSQDVLGVQSKELLLGPVQKLTWRFPSLPEEPPQPSVPFNLRHPVPARSVAARCAENSVYVEVMQDFFGNGKPLKSSAFTLGGCTATGEDPSAQVLLFESELHGCGSTLTVRFHLFLS